MNAYLSQEDEIQTASSRIWTRVPGSIFHIDSCYAMSTLNLDKFILK